MTQPRGTKGERFERQLKLSAFTLLLRAPLQPVHLLWGTGAESPPQNEPPGTLTALVSLPQLKGDDIFREEENHEMVWSEGASRVISFQPWAPSTRAGCFFSSRSNEDETHFQRDTGLGAAKFHAVTPRYDHEADPE